ncbi:hypothetical protein NHJ13734_000033 [Beauveria thailandica]
MKSYIALSFLVGAVIAAPKPALADPQLQDVAGGSKPFIRRPAPSQACISDSPILMVSTVQTEECLGTYTYCSGEAYVDNGEDFSDWEACLRSRGKALKTDEETAAPQKQGVAVGGSKPFIDMPPASQACLDPNGILIGQRLPTEECVGTIRYCEEENYVEQGEDFADSDECIRSRGKDPKTI